MPERPPDAATRPRTSAAISAPAAARLSRPLPGRWCSTRSPLPVSHAVARARNFSIPAAAPGSTATSCVRKPDGGAVLAPASTGNACARRPPTTPPLRAAPLQHAPLASRLTQAPHSLTRRCAPVSEHGTADQRGLPALSSRAAASVPA
jgi:hypothetical protein